MAAAGAAGSALAPSFPLLLLSRALVGVGCGPFISLASPLVDDAAPPHRKSLMLATLFLCIPVGFSLGYIWGSVVALALGWRAVFLLEAALMAPLAATCLLLPRPVDVRRAKPGSPRPPRGSRGGALAAFGRDLRQLAALPVVALAMLGAAMFNGALGGFSFYGPKAARALFSLDPGAADLLFGAVTVVMGVVGTLGGGLLLDGLGPSVRVALALCAAGLAAGAAAVLAAFGAAASLPQFCAAFALGEGAMFLTVSPR